MTSDSAKQEWLAVARAAVEIEAAALSSVARRLDGELIRAVELILAHPGKVVVTGIGKSGHIARKIVATLCSTGTAAVFLHPAEAVHGDLGTQVDLGGQLAFQERALGPHDGHHNASQDDAHDAERRHQLDERESVASF